MVKVEVGVLREDETVWLSDYRTWAPPDQVEKALAHVLALAKHETISGFRTSREV